MRYCRLLPPVPKSLPPSLCGPLPTPTHFPTVQANLLPKRVAPRLHSPSRLSNLPPQIRPPAPTLLYILLSNPFLLLPLPRQRRRLKPPPPNLCPPSPSEISANTPRAACPYKRCRCPFERSGEAKAKEGASRARGLIRGSSPHKGSLKGNLRPSRACRPAALLLWRCRPRKLPLENHSRTKTSCLSFHHGAVGEAAKEVGKKASVAAKLTQWRRPCLRINTGGARMTWWPAPHAPTSTLLEGLSCLP